MSPLSLDALTGRHGNRVSLENLNSTSAAVIAASMTARWPRPVPRSAPVGSTDERQSRRVGRSDIEVRQYFSFGGKAEGRSDVVATVIRLRRNRDQRRQLREGSLRLVLSKEFVQVDPLDLRLLPHQFDGRAAKRNHLLADAEL